MEKKIWREIGGRLFLTHEATEHQKLENFVYVVSYDERNGGFSLEKSFENFSFDYKIYGIESDVINRITRTYFSKVTRNLGVLFNGTKGTGKTVSAKLVCNRLKQPVIVVNAPYPNLEIFLNSIPQDITIFIDEYEKIYQKSNEMLTIMDGVMNADYRRFFILTTNQLNVESNLLQRPSRIRYLKEFTHLGPKIVEEIVDDLLINKELKKECIQFIASLELITVDIVKSVIQEINIHNESPKMFEDVFNVQKNTGKYDVYLVAENEQLVSLGKNAKIYPRPKFYEDHIGYRFEVNDRSYGRVTDVLNYDTLQITQYYKDSNGNETKNVIRQFVVKIENSIIFHSNYRFDYNSKTTMYNEGNEFAEPIDVSKSEDFSEKETIAAGNLKGNEPECLSC